MPEPVGKLVKFRGEDGLTYLRLEGNNGQAVMTSEAYEDEASADHVIERFFADGAELEVVDETNLASE